MREPGRVSERVVHVQAAPLFLAFLFFLHVLPESAELCLPSASLNNSPCTTTNPLMRVTPGGLDFRSLPGMDPARSSVLESRGLNLDLTISHIRGLPSQTIIGAALI